MSLSTTSRNLLKKHAIKRFGDTSSFHFNLIRKTDLANSTPFKNLLGEIYINSFAPGTFAPFQYFDEFTAFAGGIFNPQILTEAKKINSHVYNSLVNEFFGGEAAQIKINPHTSLKYLFIKLIKVDQKITATYVKQLLECVTAIKRTGFETKAQRIEEFFNSTFFVNSISPESYLQKKGLDAGQKTAAFNAKWMSDPRLQFAPVAQQH